jgi:putative Mg2+ transporter-C (MgtC) family protein
MLGLFDLTGQGWLQLEELILAFVLSALVGLEREIRQKSAGLRTYTLVGVSAALFMLVSKYGFNDVLSAGGWSWTRRGLLPRWCPASGSSAEA